MAVLFLGERMNALKGVAVLLGLVGVAVIVRPVAGYGMPNHLRVSIGLPAENARFLEALRKVLNA